jgi:hypothetical protein
MLNVIGLVMLIAIAALLIWSGFRVWRIRNSFLKWGGVGLAAGPTARFFARFAMASTRTGIG